MSLTDALTRAEARFLELTEALSDPAVLGSPSELRKSAKERSAMEPLIAAARDKQAVAPDPLQMLEPKKLAVRIGIPLALVWLIALFIPGFAGEDHARQAIEAARQLLRETGHETGAPWIPLGIGIHSGRSFVGTVGEGDAIDFTAVGDTVNTASRLLAAARVGEIVISAAAVETAQLETGGLEQRTLELRGREQSVEAWVDCVAAVPSAV